MGAEAEKEAGEQAQQEFHGGRNFRRRISAGAAR
jgi:hypothetical protein